VLVRTHEISRREAFAYVLYMDHSFSGDETNQDYCLDFWMYFGFVYGILFDGRVPARQSLGRKLSVCSAKTGPMDRSASAEFLRIQPAITRNSRKRPRKHENQ